MKESYKITDANLKPSPKLMWMFFSILKVCKKLMLLNMFPGNSKCAQNKLKVK